VRNFRYSDTLYEIIKIMPKNFSKKNKELYLKKWIHKIAKNPIHTEGELKEHIIHHAKQIHTCDPKLWAASMRNMLEIFEKFHGIKPSVDIQLERLQNKFDKNPNTHTPPPDA